MLLYSTKEQRRTCDIDLQHLHQYQVSRFLKEFLPFFSQFCETKDFTIHSSSFTRASHQPPSPWDSQPIMGKPLSRPGCIRKSSCCLEKHRAGEGVVGGRDVGMEGGYGDGYIPQRSIYDTMCINQQIDSHHHHSRGSVRRDGGGDGSFTYSASGSLRASRSPVDMFDPQPRSLTPNPSFVRRLDERAIYDSLKLGGQDGEDGGCHSPGHFNRSVSPSVSSFSAPGVSSSSSKKHHHHHHHHHGDSTKSRDSRHSWKVLAPPKHMECMELTTAEMIDRGGFLNPGLYPPGGQSSSLTSPLISPFSGSPMSSGYHTPVFFSPAKPRPSQSQSLRCSPPHIIQPRHYSQTQSLRLSPPHELRRSPYRAPLVQLSAHDLEHDLRERGGGWGRGDRDREWERERERELERGWAQREWERERERGRIERERARERERRETSSFGTFGYGQPVPLRSDSVFLEPDHGLDTTPLLIPQPSPSPSPNAAPRMGTGVVGRNRAGSKVGPDSSGGGLTSKFDNGSVNLVLVDSKPGYGTRMVSEVVTEHMSDIGIREEIQEHCRAEAWKRQESGSRGCVMHGSERRMGSQVKTTPGGRDLEGKVQSGVEIKERRGETKNGQKNAKAVPKAEPAEALPPNRRNTEIWAGRSDTVPQEIAPISGKKPEEDTGLEEKVSSQKTEKNNRTEAEVKTQVNEKSGSAVESREETKVGVDVRSVPVSKCEDGLKSGAHTVTEIESKNETTVVSKPADSSQTNAQAKLSASAEDKTEVAPSGLEQKKLDESLNDFNQPLKSSRSKSKSSKSCSRTRPGTATGMRPGALSPRQSKRIEDFESRGPPEGIESTWPRRIMVRKRTVRQGGALHNLPILPPLPSVISALEKRRPHLHLDSDKQSAGMVGRCSLREPSHPETGLGSSLLGRASLREQNLEHWRVYRDQEEPRRSRSREKQGTQSKEYSEKEEKKGENPEKEKKAEKVGLLEGIKKSKVEKPEEEETQNSSNRKKGDRKMQAVGIKSEKVEVKDIKVHDQTREKPDLDEVMAMSHKDESEVEEREGGTSGEEEAVEGWDAVLDMVNTLWDNSWAKHEAEGGGADTDSLPGSLQRWPLLRPPVGFGGSHPPSSAASELSLTELERRARELDSDLEHLDLSQPHRDPQDLYQTLLEPHRERVAMYQTHPGPQREKAALLTGVSSRSQVSLELNAMESPAVDSDKLPADCSAKEDSSPDSNLTLESDSSGVFLSLSNQSQEDAGSDSDQPVSGSELGSSNTSLEKDGDDGVLKEWGREESAELQWCYPTLLGTMSHEDMQEDGERLESECGSMGVDKERETDDRQRKSHKLGVVSISRSNIQYTGQKGFINVPQSERKVNTIGYDSPLSLSPSKQAVKHLLDPNQKPIRSSGLDCGDLDPFVQSDSFVYLAVSARPPSGEESKAVTGISSQDSEREHVQLSAESTKAHFGIANTEQDTKPTHLVAHKPEEGDFLCTDSFVYLAAPACLLLGPAGSAPYSGKESDSESSGSGPVDVSVLGCGSVAGDSDWDSDLSDSDPSRSSRMSASCNKSSVVARPKRLPVEPDWDSSQTESEVLHEMFTEQDASTTGNSGVSGAAPAATSPIAMETEPVTSTEKPASSLEQLSTTKKVTWQFKPAHRSVCTGSRKEKENEFSLGRLREIEDGETSRPSPSSSSSSSPSSSSSG
ncbi:uncharacterized protein LOC105356979 isoform X2 [Oryzias latipes]|uniref:uncharacterized protein LOC105356979 isoform X2 n=1 Tax=Oryzias latipes TaxID=8090 RepID=UPI000CE24B1D|nr:uncharacterized protein LOC105356979 isoform X2 [Oryzias latipes]